MSENHITVKVDSEKGTPRNITVGVDSEVGTLRDVVLHRPGTELNRLTPRNSSELLFDGLPWVKKAQEEHDEFAGILTKAGVGVHYIDELLAGALQASTAARSEAIMSITSHNRKLGHVLQDALAGYLRDTEPAVLASILLGGLTKDEFKADSSLHYRMMDDHGFIVNPLPNMMFTRDSATTLADGIAITSLAMPARRRETTLTSIIYRYHPSFIGTHRYYRSTGEPLEGGDILALSSGVLAVGVGERTSAAGIEKLARETFAAGIVHTILAVPIAQRRATMHLDTIATMVDVDTMVMYGPAVKGPKELQAFTLRAGRQTGSQADNQEGEDIQIEGPRPFLTVAAEAMGIDEINIIQTGPSDRPTADREQWDDGNNTLALAPGVVVAYERNTATNERLEAAGVQVLTLNSSELVTGRGGPRCMSCPISRDS